MASAVVQRVRISIGSIGLPRASDRMQLQETMIPKLDPRIAITIWCGRDGSSKTTRGLGTGTTGSGAQDRAGPCGFTGTAHQIGDEGSGFCPERP